MSSCTSGSIPVVIIRPQTVQSLAKSKTDPRPKNVSNNALLAEIAPDGFVTSDWLRPLHEPLVRILKVAAKDYIRYEDQIEIREGLIDISSFWNNVTPQEATKKSKNARKNADPVQRPEERSNGSHHVLETLEDLRNKFIKVDKNKRNPFQDWFLNDRTDDHKLSRKSFRNLCNSFPSDQIMIEDIGNNDQDIESCEIIESQDMESCQEDADMDSDSDDTVLSVPKDENNSLADADNQIDTNSGDEYVELNDNQRLRCSFMYKCPSSFMPVS